ncbi:hypothetical protein NQ318_019771 [Aromia moschata]|uniref:Uncharacterized protein n=1 Tax=Aromia moschata TaxID=1265417 RepID=A0AAV8YLL7_9CUCU|nr:hypothetical protein NQ318_019771 [Aromia moschata]
MSGVRLLGALSPISRNSIILGRLFNAKCNAQVRCMSAVQSKHFKLKVVDNVGVIVIDSPGVKVALSLISTFLSPLLPSGIYRNILLSKLSS